MLAYRLILNGPGGHLDSRVVQVAPDDPDGLRMKLCGWLQEERTILDDGDSITVTSVKDIRS